MILIQNGTLVSGQGTRRADVLIDGERIVAVEDSISASNIASQPDNYQSPITNDQIIDATGLLIFPGLIDVHVHLREPGAEHKEDWFTGTSAAVAGGVTTVLAMPNTSPAVTDRATFNQALNLARAKSVCDFGLYLGATNTNQHLAEQEHDLGECGLKMYMGSSTGDLLVQDFEPQYEHFAFYPRDRIIAVHAEHEPAVQYFARHGSRRPPICAELETARAVTLAQRCDRPVHICHLSTEREIEIMREAKARSVQVTCEVAPHHLFLTLDYELQTTDDRRRTTDARHPSSVIGRPSLFQMNPPLRDGADVDALWDNLDAIDCIATDHAPHTLADKQSGQPPSGVPGLETTLPLLLMAATGGLPSPAGLRLADIARLCCEGPARVFNLAHKGTITPGYDADLTFVNPDVEWVIGDRPLFTKCGWTPFAGWRVRGAVSKTFVRGQLAFDGAAVLAQPGSGRLVDN